MIGAPSFPLGAPNKRQVLLPGSTVLSGKLTNGLVGWWNFGVPQLTGTSVPDLSGTGNTGTLTNTPTKVAGRFGRALNFVPASNQYVALGTDNSLNLTGSISIAAWINPASTGETTNGRIFDRKSATTGYGFILEGTLAANALEFVINGSSVDGANYKFSNANAITIGVWQHVVAVYDSVGKTVTFYVNGVNVGGGGLTSAIASASGQAARIGARSQDNTRDFDGKINSVRVYNRTLSVAEIRQLANAPLIGFAQPIDRIWTEITRLISTGTLTQTLGNLTSASAGTVLVTGTGVSTVPALTSASAGTVLVTGTGVSTLSNLTSSSAGTVLVQGALSQTIGALTLGSTITVTGNAALNATIDPITSSSAGTVLVSGTTSATIPPITSSSAGTVLNTGALAATIDPITSSATATVLSRGALSSTLGNLTASSAGTVLVQGVLSQTIGAITLSAAVGVGFVSTGTLVKTLGNLTLSSAGKVRVTGSATPTLADLTVSSTGKVLVKAVLTKTLGHLTLTGHAINPALLPPNRDYIQIPQYNIDNPPPGDAETLAHVVLKLREMQHWFDMLSEASVQPTQFAPVNPKFGTMRYAIGQWAGTLGAVGLYIYKEGGWTHIA